MQAGSVDAGPPTPEACEVSSSWKQPARTEPYHVYIDCNADTWADSFPPPQVVKFRSAKPWQWHTWQGGKWPRKAFVFESSPVWTATLRQKVLEWNRNGTRERVEVKVFTEKMTGSRDSPGVVNLARFLTEETIPNDYVVLRVNMRGMARNLFSCLADSVGPRLLDSVYYEDDGADVAPLGLDTLRARGVLVSKTKVHLFADVLDNLNPDLYHACREENRELGLGFITLTEALEVIQGQRRLAGDPAPRALTTPVAKYSLAPWRPLRWHSSLQAASQPKGRLAIATVVARLGSSRNDPPPGTGVDLLRCAMLMQYVSMREFGGIHESDPVDYVIVHANVRDDDLQFWRKFGIKTVERQAINTVRWKKFQAGALSKIHLVSLTEYSRVLAVDGDMYMRQSIRNAFLADYEEDLVVEASPGTPHAGGLANVRPSEEAYEFLLDLANNRKFNYARGWNPDDPRSGLFAWPNTTRTMCQEDYFIGFYSRYECAIPEEWWARCRGSRVTSWTWIASSWDQGIFLYVYNISGVGTSRWIANENVEVTSGLPWFWHFVGVCKPHIYANLPKAEQEKLDVCKPMQEFFWDTLWNKTRDKYNLATECPSFEKIHQALLANKTKHRN